MPMVRSSKDASKRGSSVISNKQCPECSVTVNELLAFVSNKVNALPESTLIQVCKDAFSSDEIDTARSLALKLLAPSKKITRRKERSDQKSLEEIIKLVKDTRQLPTFVSKNFDKIPLVNFKHIDVARFLNEIAILRQDVSHIKSKNDCYYNIEFLKIELEEIKLLLRELRSLSTDNENKLILSELRSVSTDSKHEEEYQRKKISNLSDKKNIAKRRNSKCGSAIAVAPDKHHAKPPRSRSAGFAEPQDQEMHASKPIAGNIDKLLPCSILDDNGLLVERKVPKRMSIVVIDDDRNQIEQNNRRNRKRFRAFGSTARNRKRQKLLKIQSSRNKDQAYNIHPDGESVDSRTSHSDSLTSKPAPSSENAITSDSSRDVEMKSETKLPQPVIQMLDSLEVAAAKYLLAHPAAPVATLMANCETNIQRLEHSLLNSSSSVVRAARNKAARTLGVTRAQLIQRNDKTVPQPTSTSDPAQPTTNTATASTTSKNKRKAVVEDTIDISALSDVEREEMILETIKRLMDLIEEFKPSMFASYNKECERVKEEKKKLLSDGATVDKRLPKRRFPWCHRSRSLLARITTLAGSEEASAVLLADRVLPLFPKGFVRMPTLMRQANINKNMKIPEIKRQRHGSVSTVPITLHSHPSIPSTIPPAAPAPPKVQTPPLFPEQIQFPSSLTVTATVKSPEKDHLPPIMNAFSLSKDLIVEREKEKTDKKEDPYIPPNNIGSITITPVPTKDKKIDKQKSDRPSSKPQPQPADKTPSLIRVKSPAALNDAFNKKEVKTKKPDKPKDKRLDTPLQIDTSFQNSTQPKQSQDSPKNKETSPKDTLTQKQIESLRVKENNIPRPALVPVHHSPTFAKPEKRSEVKKKEIIPEVKKKKEIMIVSDLDPLSDVEPVAVDDSSSDVELIENDKSEVPFNDNKVPKSDEPNEYISRVMKDIREMEHSQEPTKLCSNSFAGIISNNSNAKHRSDANRNGLCGTRSDNDKFAERTSLNKTDGCNGNTG